MKNAIRQEDYQIYGVLVQKAWFFATPGIVLGVAAIIFTLFVPFLMDRVPMEILSALSKVAIGAEIVAAVCCIAAVWYKIRSVRLMKWIKDNARCCHH